MRWIRVHAWMPEQRDRDLRYRKREGKTVHSAAQLSSVAFGNAGDQIGGARERERRRKAADDEGLLSRDFLPTLNLPGRWWM
jgi:hypothetical protein